MSSIFKWFSNIFFNTIVFLLLVFIIVSLYCYIFKISLTRFFIYYILPIFKLIGILIHIIIYVMELPYILVKEIYKILIIIYKNFEFIFTFIFTFIINIGTFSINLTSDVI